MHRDDLNGFVIVESMQKKSVQCVKNFLAYFFYVQEAVEIPPAAKAVQRKEVIDDRD